VESEDQDELKKEHLAELDGNQYIFDKNHAK
jgi:hypothetical protein